MIPEIETRAICVTSDVTQGCAISAFFNESAKYFATFYFPDIDETSHGSFLEKIISERIATLINNVVARLRPDRVILVGLNNAQKEYFFSRFPRRMLVEIDSLDQVEDKLGFLGAQFEGVLNCRRSDAPLGLFYAKKKRLKLLLNDSAEPMRVESFFETDGVVFLEDEDDIGAVAAANYAFAINAEFRVIKSLKEFEKDNIKNYLRKKGGTAGGAYLQKIAKIAKKRLRAFPFIKYKFATFFTDGLPYGLVLENQIPFSHVMLRVRTDHFVFENIYLEKTKGFFGGAIIFSPGEFDDDETDDVIDRLNANNYEVVGLFREHATVKNFDNFVQHYPHDILHICSHGGEVEGYYVIEEFKDRDGETHKIEYEEVVGFSPVGDGEHVEVFRKAIFRKFDGLKWMSKELNDKQFPNYVWEDMFTVFRSGEGKHLRVPANYKILGSCHIKCHDSIHQGQFHAISSHGSPIVFNNTCSSWYEIAKSFIGAGARAYVGTLWNIKDPVAVSSAKVFYEKVMMAPIGVAFHEMVKNISYAGDKNVYLYWGLHFSTLPVRVEKTNVEILSELMGALPRWLESAYREDKDEEVKKNSLKAAAFVAYLIKSEMKIGGESAKTLLKELEEVKESLPPIDDASPTRDGMFENGLIDLPNSTDLPES